MEVNKVLFISQEISPYLPETPMAVMSRELPQAVQESGLEVRTFMPKYGFINERRNQLHEVIRLSGMNISIDDTDHPLIIKVATLQPVRMQVYFIFNEDYFHKSICKELETVSSPTDNDERSIFFVRGTLETVKKLRWVPEVIHCTGLISALAPLYIKDFYADDPSYQEAKVVFTLTAGYGAQMDADQSIIDTLLKNYQEVYFFPQCVGDFEYLHKFQNIDQIKILEASKQAYDEFLTNNDTDYVGTRLHGGVYAMRHARRAIIIAIDERARAINAKNHLNCIERNDIQQLDAMLNSEFETKIVMDFEAITQWKSQFKTNA